MEEVWAEIEGFPDYFVSNYGYVRSLNSGRILRGRLSTLGYLRVRLFNESGFKDVYMSQLVAKAFFHNYEPGMKVSPINGDPTNCDVRNLRFRRGPEKVRVPRPRPSWGKKVRVIETGEVFRSARQCAIALDANYGAIYSVLRGERHSHLGFTFEYLEE